MMPGGIYAGFPPGYRARNPGGKADTMDTIIAIINATPDAIRMAALHTPYGHIAVCIIRACAYYVFEDGSIIPIP